MRKYIVGLALLAGATAFAFPPSFISQVNIFLGEVASGLTTGAPLSVSSTGKIASGISFTEVSDTANVTTTSATDVVMTTMTNTPIAGTYLVNFSTWCIHSNGNATISISLYFNGSQKTSTAMTVIPFVGALSAITQDIPVSINTIVAANGTNPIAIEWHTSTGTATCHQRTMDLVRLL